MPGRHQAAAVADHKRRDVVIIGAGFAGVRMLIELRRLGLSAVALEAGTTSAGRGTGTGTWTRGLAGEATATWGAVIEAIFNATLLPGDESVNSCT